MRVITARYASKYLMPEVRRLWADQKWWTETVNVIMHSFCTPQNHTCPNRRSPKNFFSCIEAKIEIVNGWRTLPFKSFSSRYRSLQLYRNTRIIHCGLLIQLKESYKPFYVQILVLSLFSSKAQINYVFQVSTFSDML